MEQLYLFDDEEWRDVVGYEGLYQVSNKGNVIGLPCQGHKKRTFPLKPHIYRGYLSVGLYKKGKSKLVKVHRLVATAFIPNPLNFPQVNHKDEDKLNNNAWNLEWCTAKYNSNYGTHIARQAEHSKNHPSMSKPVNQYDKQGNFIKQFPSTKEVERELGIHHNTVSYCCLGKHGHATAGGFIWRYA